MITASDHSSVLNKPVTVTNTPESLCFNLQQDADSSVHARVLEDVTEQKKDLWESLCA